MLPKELYTEITTLKVENYVYTVQDRNHHFQAHNSKINLINFQNREIHSENNSFKAEHYFHKPPISRSRTKIQKLVIITKTTFSKLKQRKKPNHNKKPKIICPWKLGIKYRNQPEIDELKNIQWNVSALLFLSRIIKFYQDLEMDWL